ncbi:MAG: aminopeptidase N, partial [Methylobacter sp.]
MRDANPQTIYLKDYTVPEYLVHSVALNFALDDEDTLVSSRLILSRNPASRSSNTSLILSGENLKLIRVNLDDGNDLSQDQYLQTQDALIIHNVPQQQRFAL